MFGYPRLRQCICHEIALRTIDVEVFKRCNDRAVKTRPSSPAVLVITLLVALAARVSEIL